MVFHKCIYFLVLLFFLTTLLVGISILNKIVFVTLMLILIGQAILIENTTIVTTSPIFVSLIFSYGFLYTFLSDKECDILIRNQFMLSVSVLYVIYIVKNNKIDLDKIVKISGLILCLSTLILYYIMVFGGSINGAFDNTITEIFKKYGQGAYGIRDIIEGGALAFHFGSVPFLYIPFSLFLLEFLEKRNYLDLLAIVIIVIVMILSGSRGLLFTSATIFLILVFLRFSFQGKIILLSLITPIVIFVFNYILNNSKILSTKEDSNEIKAGHFTSFINNLDSRNFFLGDGLGAIYYTSGLNKLTAHTEITPVEMVRYFGIILGTLLFVYLLFPKTKITYYLGRNNKYVLIFAMYLIYSLTNPILINSCGFLIVVWYWSKILT